MTLSRSAARAPLPPPSPCSPPRLTLSGRWGYCLSGCENFAGAPAARRARAGRASHRAPAALLSTALPRHDARPARHPFPVRSIHKYASCSAECFILALVYIDRLIQGNNLTLTSLNVHRVIITSVMLGAKFFDDQYFNNAYYAKVGGVPCPEMNSLELEFLFSINFSLQVSGEVYNRYRGELATHLTAMMPGPDAAELHAVMIHAPAAAEPVPLDGESSASSSSSAAAAGASSAVVAPGQAPWAGEDEDEDVDSGAVTAFATM